MQKIVTREKPLDGHGDYHGEPLDGHGNYPGEPLDGHGDYHGKPHHTTTQAACGGLAGGLRAACTMLARCFRDRRLTHAKQRVEFCGVGGGGGSK